MKANSQTRLLLIVVLAFGAALAAPILIQAQTSRRAPTLKRSTNTRRPVRRTTPTAVVPAGTNLKVRLEDTLSTKEARVGDTFTATVLSPTRFEEATLHGRISSIQKSGKVQGRTSMNLAFNSIEMRDGRKGTLHGYVTRVYGSGSGQADQEGGVESASRGKHWRSSGRHHWGHRGRRQRRGNWFNTWRCGRGWFARRSGKQGTQDRIGNRDAGPRDPLVGFNKEDRGRALTLIQAMSTPAGVTREGVLQLNERMLQLWKDKVY